MRNCNSCNIPFCRHVFKYNDVAVLTLDSPVQFTQNVRPICLPEASKRYSSTQATVIGWGSLRESKDHGLSEDH